MDLSSVPPWAWAGILTSVLSLLSLTFVIGKWVGSVNIRLDAITDSIAKIQGDIKRIFDRLDRLPPTPLEHSSPLRLSDLGRNITETLGGQAWAQHTAAIVRKQVVGQPEYEVQEFCFDYVSRFDPDQELDTLIKACAYEYGIDRDAVLSVLAIELRDSAGTGKLRPAQTQGDRGSQLANMLSP